IRELERLIERAVALTDFDTIELDDLPATVLGDYRTAILPSLKRNETLRVWASHYARLILDRCQGNKREACRVLGISYHTLQAYLRMPRLSASQDSPADPAVAAASIDAAQGELIS